MKDTLCSYYTESDDITSYMVSKVTVSDGDVILEPSAGEGIFIDELLKTNKSFRVDAALIPLWMATRSTMVPMIMLPEYRRCCK